jgi:hypothetical protein
MNTTDIKGELYFNINTSNTLKGVGVMVVDKSLSKFYKSDYDYIRNMSMFHNESWMPSICYKLMLYQIFGYINYKNPHVSFSQFTVDMIDINRPEANTFFIHLKGYFNKLKNRDYNDKDISQFPFIKHFILLKNA